MRTKNPANLDTLYEGNGLATRFGDILAALRPGSRFATARFATYQPNPAFPGQAQARDHLQAFVASLAPRNSPFVLRRVFQRPSRPEGRGLYLDGGFGVGKTHLLASAFFMLADEAKPPGARQAASTACFLSFHELMYLLGALGVRRALSVFASVALLCIDEFELDDPGSTHMINTFLSQALARGLSVIATSNTPPDALGEGRFNAHRFADQLQDIAARFEVLRLDGPDYRQRDARPSELLTPQEYEAWAERQRVNGLVEYDTSSLQTLLLTVHPAQFGKLLGGVRALGVRELTTMTHEKPMLRENTAIRFVHFIDKVYEAGIAVGLTGVPLRDLFHERYRDLAYAKKYRRCLSRLSELMTEARA